MRVRKEKQDCGGAEKEGLTSRKAQRWRKEGKGLCFASRTKTNSPECLLVCSAHIGMCCCSVSVFFCACDVCVSSVGSTDQFVFVTEYVHPCVCRLSSDCLCRSSHTTANCWLHCTLFCPLFTQIRFHYLLQSLCRVRLSALVNAFRWLL